MHVLEGLQLELRPGLPCIAHNLQRNFSSTVSMMQLEMDSSVLGFQLDLTSRENLWRSSSST